MTVILERGSESLATLEIKEKEGPKKIGALLEGLLVIGIIKADDPTKLTWAIPDALRGKIAKAFGWEETKDTLFGGKIEWIKEIS